MTTPDPDTFCTVPFLSIRNTNNGEFQTCCDGKAGGTNIQNDKVSDVWNGPFFRQLRLDLINGVKNKNCESCWKTEEQGAFSLRQHESTGKKVIPIMNMVNSDGSMKKGPDLFDIKLGNLCNSKCITCCQMYSSQHEAEINFWKKSGVQIPNVLNYIEENYMKDETYRITDLNKVLDNLDVLNELEHLRFTGGEPFINPFVKEVLSRITKTDMRIEIITNLSEVDFELIDKFTNLQITGSIDHVDDEKFNFIRFPLNYKTCSDNFRQIKNKKEISFTGSIFNIFDLKEILDEFHAFNAPVSFNFVNDPNYWCIKYLDRDQKDEICKLVQRLIDDKHPVLEKNLVLKSYLAKIEQYLHDTPSDFDLVVKERTRVLKLYDETRKTDSKRLFPFIRYYE